MKRIPHNVLRHILITPRLQRLFHDAETREDVLWHSGNQEYRDQNVMSHPSRGSEWKSVTSLVLLCTRLDLRVSIMF